MGLRPPILRPGCCICEGMARVAPEDVLWECDARLCPPPEDEDDEDDDDEDVWGTCVRVPPPQHLLSTEMNVLPAVGWTSGGTKPAWLVWVSGGGTVDNSRKVCSIFLRVVGVRVGVVRVGTPLCTPSRELSTKLVIVGVSSTGVSPLLLHTSPLSDKLVTAVIVKLKLGTTSLVTDVCVVLPLLTEAVVCGTDVARGLMVAAEVVVTVACARVNMLGLAAAAGLASRTQNFLLVTWGAWLTNMGWWRHSETLDRLLPLLR